MQIASKILSDLVIYLKYAKFLPDLKRRETWEELVTRNKNMHLKKFPQLKEEIDEAYSLVYDRKVLPSMRSMQFAGKAIEVAPTRIYNCSYLPIDNPAAFSEVMVLLLWGVGVGYSVQKHHVDKLPEIIKPKRTRRFLIPDSIEGWADAVKVLVRAYFGIDKSLPLFDFRDIRPKGSLLVTSGGKAPGPEPLKDCLHNIQKIFERKQTGEKLTPIEAHDILCYIADGVLAGGIRRSAMIALFSFDDEEMLSCKFNNWYDTEPQRARANNSAVILRHKIKKNEFLDLWEKIRLGGNGEPGFFFTNDKEWGCNPCGEVSLRANQFCNLVTINASDVENQADLNNRVRAASFIATLQASYTDFHYLREEWKEVTEKEALIGVSMTGIASGKVLKLDLKNAAQVVVDENERVAKLIGINKAARCTVIKPEGTSSIVLGASSGVHGWHAKWYLRRLRIGKNEAIYNYLVENHPELVEDEYFKPHSQAIVSVPQAAPESAITREEPALQLLKRISHIYNTWIKTGHRKGHNLNNVSATVTIKPHEWEDVGQWMWENRNNYTALSILPHAEDTNYPQLPFEEITKKEYDLLVKSLHEVDLSKIVELDDDTKLQENLGCGGNACEIK